MQLLCMCMYCFLHYVVLKACTSPTRSVFCGGMCLHFIHLMSLFYNCIFYILSWNGGKWIEMKWKTNKSPWMTDEIYSCIKRKTYLCRKCLYNPTTQPYQVLISSSQKNNVNGTQKVSHLFLEKDVLDPLLFIIYLLVDYNTNLIHSEQNPTKLWGWLAHEEPCTKFCCFILI